MRIITENPVSPTQKAEAANRMAESRYAALVGATAHDMKGLLTPLRSSTDSLLSLVSKGNLDPEALKKELFRMAGRVAMMEHLMDDMRTYAQPTPPQRHREPLLALFKDAHVIVKDTIRGERRDSRRVTTYLRIPKDLTVEVSRHQMVLALSNVLKNACEAYAATPNTFGRGEVLVKAKTIDGDRVEVLVQDAGMGLSKDELAEVRRFIPGGTSKKAHGTGFGLPIARRKITDHGGTLDIESELDVGTTVIITLPVRAEG